MHNSLLDYQERAGDTAQYPHHDTGEVAYVLLGLLSEVGELVEQVVALGRPDANLVDMATCKHLPSDEHHVAARHVSHKVLNDFHYLMGRMQVIGEHAGEIKRTIRDTHPDKILHLCHIHPADLTTAQRERLTLELGDVLWYLARLMSELRVLLWQVAQANVEKLASRRARGVIQGKGGTR